MRRIAAVAAGVLLAVLVAAATAGAQGTKTVRGTVAKTAPDAVTVTVGDNDMTFKVDSTTKVTARGGSTAAREAEAKGKSGTPYTSLVKTGQGVEVAYHENGMHAASIRVLPSVPPPPPPQSARSMDASGVVTAVSNTSVTIKGSGGESTFSVNEKTTVIGTGVGTKGAAMKKAGEKPHVTDFVHNGDSVSVRYKEEGGTKLASQVRITRKAKS
jgi:hypothetical protein